MSAIGELLAQAILAGIKAQVDASREPTESVPSSIPGLMEVPSTDSSCSGCVFCGVVPIGHCPVPKCLGIARPDGRDVWFEKE